MECPFRWPDGLPPGTTALSLTRVADSIDVRLLGFAGFEASERFLHSLAEEIWVARWDRSQISVRRPAALDTADAMRAELQQPSLVTVVSAHAGYFCDGRRLGLCGQGDQPVLLADSVGRLGAVSMVLIDSCYAADLAAELRNHAQPGSLLVGLNTAPRASQETRGRDSVAALGAVIRELCYPNAADLSPGAVRLAVESVNAQITTRNLTERRRRVTNPRAMRPLIDILEC
jgi:hypothetical protein